MEVELAMITGLVVVGYAGGAFLHWLTSGGEYLMKLLSDSM